MKKIIVNGQMYLGSVKTKDGNVIVENAMAVRGKRVNRTVIADYLKQKNLDELETIEFSGNGTSVSKSRLTDEEEMIFDICERAMRFAEKKAKSGMVNNEFEEALGKL